MFNKAVILCLLGALLFSLSCEDNSSEPIKEGYLAGKVTVDGQGVEGVLIDVSSFHVSGGNGAAKAAQASEYTAAGDFAIELIAGTYRADFAYFSSGEQNLITARYPLNVTAGETTYVNVELKDPKPYCVLALDANSAVELSWECAYNAVEYKIYRADSTLGNFLNINTVNSSTGTLYYTDMPPTTGKYSYYITSVNAADYESDYSEIVEVEFTAEINPPTGFTAIDQVEYVSLSWNDNTRARGYRIYRSTGDDQNWQFIDSTTDITYQDEPASYDNYYYYVTSVSIYDTESEKSPSAMVNYDGKFDPVENLTISDRGSDLYLNWLDYDNVAYYAIYRSLDPDLEFTRIDSTTNSHYSDIPADTGTYFYYITVFSAAGLESDQSDTVSARYDRVLESPTGFTAENKGLYVGLRWNEVQWAGAYIILRNDGGSSDFFEIASVAGSITSYNDTPPYEGVYEYKIATETLAGIKGPRSTAITVYYIDNLLPPSNVDATSAGTYVKVDWESSFGATSYKVYSARNETGVYEYVDSTLDTSFVDIPEIEGQYYYKIKACDNIGHVSQFSNSAYVYFSDKPLPPYDIVAVDSLYKVTLWWHTNEFNADYMLYRSNTMESNYQHIETIDNDTIATDWPSVGGHYFYKLRTIASGDTSDLSQFVHILFSGDLAAPQNLSGYDAGSYVHLEWDQVAGASEYRIYVAESIDGEYVYDLTEDDNSAGHFPESEGVYFYKVKAVTEGDLHSPFSNAVQVEFEP